MSAHNLVEMLLTSNFFFHTECGMGMTKSCVYDICEFKVLTVITIFFSFSVFSVVLCCRDSLHLCIHRSVLIMPCQPNKRVTV